MTRVLSVVWRTAIWLVIIAGIAVIAAVVVVPRVAGATPYSVLTGSMRPDYPPGTLVVVRPVASEDIRVGDVITYQLESGARQVVTHRVTEVAWSMDGEQRLRTQGDDNDVVDAEPVRPVQIKGRLWYSLPYLGRVVNLVEGNQRQLGLYVVATALLGYAGFMFTSAARDRRRGRRTEEAQEGVTV